MLFGMASCLNCLLVVCVILFVMYAFSLETAARLTVPLYLLIDVSYGARIVFCFFVFLVLWM